MAFVGADGTDDTKFLLQADLKPYFRYSPLLGLIFTKRQEAAVLDKLRNDPPDYLVLPLLPLDAPDVLEDLRKAADAHSICSSASRAWRSFGAESRRRANDRAAGCWSSSAVQS